MMALWFLLPREAAFDTFTITSDPQDYVQWGTGVLTTGTHIEANGRTFLSRVSERQTTEPDGPVTNTGYPITFTTGTPGIINMPAHGKIAGYNFNLTTDISGGTLPTGLAFGTDGAANGSGGVAGKYFLKTVLDPDTFTFSLTNGGTAINLTNTGTPTIYVSDPTNRYAVRVMGLGGGDDLEFYGGRVMGDLSLNADIGYYGLQTGGYNNSAGLLSDAGGPNHRHKKIFDVRVGGIDLNHGVWDGMSFASGVAPIPGGSMRNHVEGVWVSAVRDDAIENDTGGSLTVRDSLFDRCYMGFSNTGEYQVDLQTGDTIDVEDCLMRLTGYPTTGGGLYPLFNTIGRFFKLNTGVRSPKWTALRTIFAMDTFNATNQSGHQSGWIIVWQKCISVTDSSFLYLGYDTVTFSTGTPGVVNWPLHARVAGARIKFKTTGTLPPELTAETTYFIKTKTSVNDFTLAATLGGTAIDLTGVGSGTISASAIPDIGTINAGLTQDVGASAIATWDAARSAWIAAHPDIDRMPYDTE